MTNRSLLLAILSLVTLEVCAQKEKMQSSYIYSFTHFVNWSATDKNQSFIIGVLGSGTIIQELKSQLTNKKVENQNIVITQYNNIAEISDCQILFVKADNNSRLNEVISRMNGKQTLIITEDADAKVKGSCINLINEGNKLSFEINEANILKQGLQVNSQLAQLGTKVN